MNNTRIYFRILIVTLFIGITSSCTYDETIYGSVSDANVTLTLTLGDQVQGSRATEDGVDNLNENAIKTVELFFYAAGSSDTNAPVYTTTIALPEGTKSSATLTPTIPADKLSVLFPSNGSATTCNVYAIVNRPTDNDTDNDNTVLKDNELPTDKSIASLKKNVVLYAEFTKEETISNKKVYTPQKQTSFVMDGSATLNRTAAGLSGEIKVERVAAKVSLLIDKIEPVTIDGIKWEQTGDVKISFMNSSARTKLGFLPNLEGYVYEPKAADLLDMENITLTKSDNGWSHNVPFYTYPINWANSESTHIILTVQWTKDKGATKTTTYYSLNVNPGASYTERNHYYKITQEISVLGSTTVEEAIQLEPSYQVLGWGADQLSSANLDRFRYLVVDETSVTMKNIVTKKILFDSSAPIYLKSAKVDWDNISQAIVVPVEQANENYDSPTSGNEDNEYPEYELVGERLTERDGVDYKAYITIHNADEKDSENYILVEHELDNSMDKYADYSRYQIELVVAHQDNALTETIKITQYPMLSVEAVTNYDYTHDDPNKSGNSVNEYKGYVYINGNQETDSDKAWSYVGGWPSSNISQNPNKYIVTVSSLSNTSIAQKYIIGDARAETPWSTIPSGITTVNGTTLNNYYPADRNATSGLISPQFMVASSYGYCQAYITTIDAAEKRCAAYQEDGYPAGRWRVPTSAEVQYLIQLSEWEVIPTLFSNGQYYWSAQGAVTYNNNAFTTKQGTVDARVRCVYDTWYWGTDKLENIQRFEYACDPIQ